MASRGGGRRIRRSGAGVVSAQPVCVPASRFSDALRQLSSSLGRRIVATPESSESSVFGKGHQSGEQCRGDGSSGLAPVVGRWKTIPLWIGGVGNRPCIPALFEIIPA